MRKVRDSPERLSSAITYQLPRSRKIDRGVISRSVASSRAADQ
jgi:hypothetical protein